MSAPHRVAVIGAGPIGLETALLAAQSGFDVHVYERGRVAENVCDWGHVRLFSPFGLNASEWGRKALANSALPDGDVLLTGREFAECYLLPLSRLPELAGRIHEGVSVRAVSRSRSWKGDLIGRRERWGDPFQLLLRDGTRERIAEADYVFDCSGTYPYHNWLGAGGMPCVGEMDAAESIAYRLPDLTADHREHYAGRTTLVVGSGYSAATTVVGLARLAERDPSTRIVWLTRTDRTPPISRFAADPLTERDRLARAANELATADTSHVEWRNATVVRRVVARTDGSGFLVTVERFASGQGSPQTEELIVDRIVANVGYRPDRRLYEELQVHECYATGGPMKLAAALLGETSADCLSQASHGADVLCNPEPGFFILGAKSYGRDSRFLLRTGFEQIRDMMSLIQDGAIR